MATTSSRWTQVDTPIYRWVRTIERIVSAEPLPELSGSVVNVFSDYGGDHKGSSYEVTGVLYMDLYASAEWESRRRLVRSRYLADGRRLAFKALGDRQRQAALVPFLEAADDIAGLCLVVAIRKSITQLCVDAPLANALVDRLQLRRQWRHRNLERMLRVAHLIGLLIGGLSRPGQHIYWFSDEDAMFANDAITMDLREMLARFSSHYTRHPLGELGLGTTVIDEGDRFEEDHVAVPDLAVGAVAEMVTRLSSAAGGRIRPHLAIPFADRFSPKTEVICSWFADQGSRLRKVCIVFERLSSSQLAVFRLDMQT